MCEKGFTVAEVVVVLAILSILLFMGTHAFSSYSKRSKAEIQTKSLHADLMKHRAEALYCKKRQAVRCAVDTFSAYSTEETGCGPLTMKKLGYPVVNAKPKISFDENGFSETLTSVCIADTENGAAVDSVVISRTRIQIGKRKTGESCLTENIVTY